MAHSRLMPALIGSLTIPVAYWCSSAMFGRRTGSLFAIFVAFSPWHICVSRYGDNEHVLISIHALAVIGLLAKCKRGPNWCVIPLGMVTGLSWYIYASNTVLIPVVFVTLLVGLYTRRDRLRSESLGFLGFLISFGIVTLPIFLHKVQHGQFIPMNVQIDNEGDSQYSLVDFPGLITGMKNSYDQLFVTANEPFFSAPFGSLGPLQSALLFSSGILLVNGIRKREFACSLLALCLTLSVLPAWLSTESTSRRLFLFCTIAMLVNAKVIDLCTGHRTPRRFVVILSGLFLFGLLFSVTAYRFFDLTRVSESSIHEHHKELTNFVLEECKKGEIIIYVSEDHLRIDLDRFLWLEGYRTIRDLRLQEGRLDGVPYSIYWMADYPRVFENLRDSGSSCMIVVPGRNYPDWRGRVVDLKKIFPMVKPDYRRNESGTCLFVVWNLA